MNVRVEAKDVAVMMALLKIARTGEYWVQAKDLNYGRVII